VNAVKDAFKKHDKIVLSFAMLGAMNETNFINENFPQVKYVTIEVDRKILMERFMDRQDIFMKEHGMTYEALWQSPHMEEARKKHGEEYTKEKCTLALEESLFAVQMVKAPANGFVINNNDIKSGSGIE
jgi:gluconate kinase